MGIDLGTQSIKVIVYAPVSKTVLASASARLEMISREDGSREQSAQWWLDGFHSCLQQISAEHKASVVAIGVSGQQHGFVPVAANGEVLAPVKLWCDTSTVTECEDIMAAVGGERRCRELGGNSIVAGYTASKILFLKNNASEAYAKMSTVMLPHDYMNFYLTGERRMECGDASGTGLLDVKQRCWSAELIHAMDSERDLTSCFPKLIESYESVGTVRSELARELGLGENVIVSAGGGDNMMAAIGTGNVRNGCLTASLGTSGTLFAHSDQAILDSEGELAAFCSSTGGWLPLLCTMNCTVATEQLRDLFSLELDEIESLVAGIDAGSDGVLTLPFYNGERTPALPKAKALIYGLDMDNTDRAHLLRSAMEAAVFGLKTGLLAFRRCGMKFAEVTLTGGGSNSAVWCQMCANVFDLPVTVFEETENAAFGALLQALWCYQVSRGEHCTIDDVVVQHLRSDQVRSCIPDPAKVAIYEQVFSHYQRLLNTVTPLYTDTPTAE
jgi:xylulokinase